MIKNEIEKTNRWWAAWKQLAEQAEIGAAVRPHMSGAFQHLCLEHHVGLLKLVEGGIYSSAFALYRSQFDAFIRGAWIRACSSDDWMERFRKNEKEPPNVKDLLKDLEKTEGYTDGNLMDFRDLAYGLLCDFTHGGTVQILMRVAPGSIKQGWSEENVAGLLRSSSALALLGCIEISRLANNEEMANAFARFHQEIYLAPGL